jgi:hypothetical protein
MEQSENLRQFDVGDPCEDKVTGYQGTIVAVARYLDGCTTVGVQSRALHEGRPVKWFWFDIKRAIPQRAPLPERTPPPETAGDGA